MPGAVAASFVFASIRLLFYARRYAVNILYWDEWDYVGPLFDGASPRALFSLQHGPHRMGLGLWLVDALFEASSWDSRWVEVACASIYVLATVLALWLKRRLAGPLTVWDACIPLLFLQLSTFETWAMVPDPSHGPLPLVLALSFALALTSRSDRLAALLAATAACLATYTGFALFIAPVALVVFALNAVRARQDCGPWVAAFALTLACIATFFVGYRFEPAVDCFVFPWPHPLDYLRFFGTYAAHPLALDAVPALREPLRIAAASAGLGLTLFALSLSARSGSRRWLCVFALAGYSTLFGANAAVGRVCLGAGSASPSRYVPYAACGAFALYLALHDLPGRARLRAAALSVFLGLSILQEASHASDRKAVRSIFEIKARWRDCYLRTHDADACQHPEPIYPRPSSTGLQRKLDFLERHGFNLFKS